MRASLFGGWLSQSQVDGMTHLLDEGERRGVAADPLAYVLATAFHETDATMQPVKEYGGPQYYHRMYDPLSPDPGRAAFARQNGALPGDGVKYFGRGHVQLTWRRNYDVLGRRIGVDLVANPDLMLMAGVSARVTYEGMVHGLFTGLKLADFFGPGRRDFVGARRIINGTDRDRQIAEIAQRFRAALS